jgi:transcriptional regulator with XRE-family HTH domain
VDERIQDRFGRNLAAARAHKRMGQADVARLAEIDQSYMSLIETGKRTVSIAVAERLALAVGVPVGVLLDANSQFPAAPTKEK